MFNKVIIIGNLTRDVEFNTLSNATSVAKSAIATSFNYKNSLGENKEEICFLDFTIFGKVAEVARNYTRKGSRVMLDGRLVFEQWTASDGGKRSKHSLMVETLKLLDSKKESENHFVAEEKSTIAPNKTMDDDFINDFKEIPF